MPDQPNDAPQPPGPDDQTTELDSTAAEESTASTPADTGEPIAASPSQSWTEKPLHLTRAVAVGTAAGILLVGGVAGLAIGVTLAGDDSHDHSPGRGGWHIERTDRGDRGGMPDRGQGGWREQGPPGGFGPDGPDYFGPENPDSDGQSPDEDSPTPTDPSDSST